MIGGANRSHPSGRGRSFHEGRMQSYRNHQIARLPQRPIIHDEVTLSYREVAAFDLNAHHEQSDEHAFNLVAKLRQAAIAPELRTYRSAQRGRPSCSFRRFLHLPAELRNQIYAYVVHDPRILRLRCFTTPAIARASRQLRQESLALFFSVNHFVAEVKTTYAGCTRNDRREFKPRYLAAYDEEYRTTGILSVATDINPLILPRCAQLALFRNFDICIVSPINAQLGHAWHEEAVLSFRHDAPIRVSTHVRDDTFGGPAYGGRKRQDVTNLIYLLRLGASKLEMMTANPNYHGIALAQLKGVALAFRAAHIDTPDIPKPLPLKRPPTVAWKPPGATTFDRASWQARKQVATPRTLSASSKTPQLAMPRLQRATSVTTRTGIKPMNTIGKHSETRRSTNALNGHKPAGSNKQSIEKVPKPVQPNAQITKAAIEEDYELADAESYFDSLPLMQKILAKAPAAKDDDEFSFPEAESYFFSPAPCTCCANCQQAKAALLSVGR